MPKYDPEKKAAAMSRMAEIGVLKTSEELSISVPTLYKWRNETGKKTTRRSPSKNDLRSTLSNDPYLEKKLKQVEADNSTLREENQELREKVAKLKSALLSMIE